MNNSTKLLSSLSRNGVLLLSKLRFSNYPMFIFVMSNYDTVVNELKEVGIEVLNDLRSLREREKIRMYLKYHYGDVLNLTEVREVNRTIYNYVSELGNVREVLEGMGFTCYYDSTYTEDKLLSELRSLPKDRLTRLGEKLYNKVYYRAIKEGFDNVTDYMKSKGLL